MTLLGPYLVACSLLVVAGTAKVARPRGTTTVLHHVFPRIPSDRLFVAVRLLALAESILGAAGLVLPISPIAIGVSASYAGFAAFVIYARVRVPTLATCGCLPVPDLAQDLTRSHGTAGEVRRGSAAETRDSLAGQTNKLDPDTDPVSAADASGTASTRAHILIDLALARLAGSVGAAGATRSILSLLSKQPLDGVPLVAASAVATWMVILWLVALPRLSLARHLVEDAAATVG